MKVEQLCDFGCVIYADDSADIFNISTEQIETLLSSNHLLLFRGFEQLSTQALQDFAERLGDLLEWDFGAVLDLKIQKNPKNHIFRDGRVELHWDGSYLGEEKTPRFSLFQCLEGLGNKGGETIFCNALKAYENADSAYKNRLNGSVITYTTEKKAHFGGRFSWPLVCPIRYGAEPVIRYIEAFNEDNADINPVDVSIEGLDKQQTDLFLKQLNQYLYSSEFLYEHRWTKGDFLLFNNDALLHGRNAFGDAADSRHLQRIHIL